MLNEQEQDSRKIIDSMIIKKEESKIKYLLLTALIILMIGAVCGCGEDDADKGGSSDGGSSDTKGVASKYADILSDDNATYYLNVESYEETGDSRDVFNDVQTIAQKGSKKKYVSSESQNTQQYYLDGKLYYYDGNNMTYYVMNQGPQADDVNKAYAPNEGYKKTKKKEFDGEKLECDIYENEVTEEGTVLINRTEYFVDGSGDLKGVVSTQLNKSSLSMVSKVTMKVRDFKTKIPEGTFTRPEGYTKVK